MFGLSMEKLILIGVLAAIIIGPQRLPVYAEKLATLIRNFRSFTEATRSRAEQEWGLSPEVMAPATWNGHLQHYGSRRIVRDALRDDPAVRQEPDPAPAGDGDGDRDGYHDTGAGERTETGTDVTAQVAAESPDVQVRERWIVVGGSSGHPVRRRIVETVPETAAATDIADADTPDIAATAAGPASSRHGRG